MQHATSAIAATQATTMAPVTPLVLQPTRTIQTGPFSLRSPAMVASPDGQAVYLLTAVPSINVWKSLVYLTPEIGVGIGCIAALLVLRRVVKRPQEVGERYCRRCNYLLKNHSGDRCPECGQGLDARRVLPGARRNVRIALLGALIMSFLALYLSDGLSRMRHMPAGDWIDWRSTWLAQSSLSQHWAAARAGYDNQWIIMRINIRSGEATSVPIDARDDLRGLKVGMDGRSVGVWGEKGVYSYSVADGSRIARRLLRRMHPDSRWQFGIVNACFTADLGTAFAVNSDGGIGRWTMNSGAVESVLHIRDDLARYANLQTSDARIGPAILTDPGSGAIVVLDQTAGVAPASIVEPPYRVVRPHSGLDFIFTGPRNGDDDIIAYRLSDGSHFVMQRSSTLTVLSQRLILPARRWLVIEDYAFPSDLMVWDVSTGQCAFRLVRSSPVYSAHTVVNDHTVARLISNPRNSPSPFAIDIFDLNSIPQP